MRKKKIVALALLFIMLTSTLVPFIYKNEACAAGRMIIALIPESDIKVGQEFALYVTARNADGENTTANMKLSFDKSLVSYVSSDASDASCGDGAVTATGARVKFTFKAIAQGNASFIARATAGGNNLESAGIRVNILQGEGGDDNDGGDDNNGGDDNDGGDDNNDGEDGDGDSEEPEEPVVIDVKESAEYKALQENYSKLYDRYNLLKNDKRRFFTMTIIFGALAVLFLVIIIFLLVSRRRSDDYDDYDGPDGGGFGGDNKPEKKSKKRDMEIEAEKDRLREEAIARDLAAREEKMRMNAMREETPRQTYEAPVDREVKKNQPGNDDYLERTASKSEQADVDIAKQVSRIIAMRTSKLASPDQVEGLVKEDISPKPAKVNKNKKNAFDEDDLFLMDIDDL